MDKEKNKFNKYLIIGCVVLVILYSFSFFKKPTVDTRKPIKTALVNPKYKNEINQIFIKNGENSVNLIKNDDFWEISDLKNEFIKLPADSAKINAFLENLTTVIEVYKIADKKDNEKNYDLDENAFDFSFYVNGELAGEILFGKQDFSQTKRYVTSVSNKKVFEMEDNVENFLSVNVSLWSEPFIISRQVLGSIKKDDIQRIIVNNSEIYTNSSKNWSEYASKILELRQGGILNKTENLENPIYQLKMELGNKKEISIFVYNSDKEEEFILKNIYFDFSKNKTYEFYSLISSWTFSSLKYK